MCRYRPNSAAPRNDVMCQLRTSRRCFFSCSAISRPIEKNPLHVQQWPRQQWRTIDCASVGSTSIKSSTNGDRTRGGRWPSPARHKSQRFGHKRWEQRPQSIRRSSERFLFALLRPERVVLLPVSARPLLPGGTARLIGIVRRVHM